MVKNVDFFPKELQEKYKKIGVSVSGGVDSALVFYCMCKTIQDEGLTETHEIYPISSSDSNRKDGKEHTLKIIQTVQNIFPNVKIHECRWDSFDKFDKNFVHKCDNLFKDLLRDGINITLTGATTNISKDLVFTDKLHTRDLNRDSENIEDTRNLYHSKKYDGMLIYKPFAFEDKFFISDCYEEYGIVENILPLTISCVNPVPLDSFNPCKECYWCQEKFLAFGTFDTVAN